MKSLIKILACLSILLPMSASAANFGGFKVGQKFSLKVTKITSIERVGYFGSDTKAPIPSSFPKYKKKSMVAFAIGKKGVLTAKGLSIPFAHAKPTENEYSLFNSGTVTVSHTAEIAKNSNNKPIGGTLTLSIQDFSGAEPVFRTVIYELK